MSWPKQSADLNMKQVCLGFYKDTEEEAKFRKAVVEDWVGKIQLLNIYKSCATVKLCARVYLNFFFLLTKFLILS